MADKEVKEKTETTEVKQKFVNPFEAGVNYSQFLEAVNKSKKTVADYCKGHLTKEQLEWLENDLGMYKK